MRFAKPTAPYRAPCNDVALAKLHRITHVVRMLTNRGLSVVGFRFSGGTPEIELIPCPQLQKLIDDGQAFYRSRWMEPGASGREGSFDIDECRIVWRETAQ